MTRVLLLCPDRIGTAMAGVGIRYWEMARVLARRNQVTLATPLHVGVQPTDFRVATYVDGSVHARRLVAEHDVVVVQGFSSLAVPAKDLQRRGQALVVDLYCPFFFENALGGVADPKTAMRQHRMDASVLQEQLWHGDFFLCANERQRDLVIGMLAARGRLTPELLKRDTALNNLVAVVPFGISRDRLDNSGRAVHDCVPGITRSDRVVVWGGGIYEWLDPITPIRAMERVQRERGDIKLLFATNRGPHGGALGSKGQHTLALARDNGTLGRSVFFHDGWFSYAARGDYLRGAAAGIVSHPDHIETRYAFRTRVLDYLWAELPLLLTEGDSFAALAVEEQLGSTVPAEDPDAMAKAMIELVSSNGNLAAARQRVTAIRSRFHWEHVLGPISAYCDQPRRTRMTADPVLARMGTGLLYAGASPLNLLSRTFRSIQEQGPHQTRLRIERYVSRRLSRVIP